MIFQIKEELFNLKQNQIQINFVIIFSWPPTDFPIKI